MFEHPRRGREEDERVESEPQRTAHPSMGMLALQATAGNRAMVQRLMYSQQNSRLTVPASFAAQTARWNDDAGHVNDTSQPKSLFELWTSYKVREALQLSLGVDYLKQLNPVADKDLAEEAKSLAQLAQVPEGETAEQAKTRTENDNKLVKAISDSAVSHTRLIFDDLAPFTQKTLLPAFTFIPAVKDLLPEKPDLPLAGQSVKDEIPGTEDREGKRKKYWEYTCVLIALYKNEGIAKVNAILKAPVADDLGLVVQALHDHYIENGVQYDDTSTRMTVMKQWGYRMIFGGNVPWTLLPQHARPVPDKKYIVDIEGHTVKMTVKKQLPATKDPLPLAGEYFECESDRQNYSTSEFLKNVLYVWQGS